MVGPSALLPAPSVLPAASLRVLSWCAHPRERRAPALRRATRAAGQEAVAASATSALLPRSERLASSIPGGDVALFAGLTLAFLSRSERATLEPQPSWI